MVFPCHNVDTELLLLNGHERHEKANLPWQQKIDEAFVWALENYGRGRGFVMPNFKIVKGGGEGMRVMRLSASGKASFEKFTIDHPL